MLNAQTVGFAGGLGAVSCASTYCAGTGTTDILFRQLQTAANEAARKLGMGAPITVDGKIGSKTVAKLYDISVAMPPRTDLTALFTIDNRTTFTWVANNASRILDELNALITGGPLRPTAPTTTPTPTSLVPLVAVPAAPAPGPAPMPPMPSPARMSTAAKLGLAGGAVALLLLAFFALRRRPARAMAGLGRGRRGRGRGLKGLGRRFPVQAP